MRKCRKMISLIVLMAMLATLIPFQALAADATVAATSEDAAAVEEIQEADTEKAAIQEDVTVEEAVIEETTVVEETVVEEALVAEEPEVEETVVSEEPEIKEAADAVEETAETVPEAATEEAKSEEITTDITPEVKPTDKHAKDVTVEYATASFTLVWDDNDDKAGIRPDSVKIALYKDGSFCDAGNVSAENNWTFTFEKLPAYYEGNLCEYSVIVAQAVVDYRSTVGEVMTVKDADGNITGYTGEITCTYVPAKVNVTVNNLWDDSDNQDGIRPETVKVMLEGDGELCDAVWISEENNWTYTWNDLPANNDKGIAVEYTAMVAQGVEGYNPSTYEVKAEKDADGNITGYMIDVTSVHNPDKTEINTEIIWADDDDRDGVRPESVIVQLTADDGPVKDNPKTAILSQENNWKYTWEDLDKKAAGKDIVYSVDEEELPEGYHLKEVTPNEDKTSFTIMNLRWNEPISGSIAVVWDDNDNIDQARPDSVKVILKADGEKILEYDFNENSWKAAWENFSRYKNHGEEIEYTLEVEPIDGYTTEISLEKEVDNSGKLKYVYTVTNTLSEVTPVEKTKVHVQITWDDNDNIDGGRPESVEAQLYAIQQSDTEGEVYKEIGDPVAVTEESGWRYTWENLDKKDSKGNTISYEIMLNYMCSGTSYDETEDGIVASITIERYPYLQIWTVECLWNDADDIDNARPESVEFRVQSIEGKPLTDPLVLNEGNGWKGTFEYYPGENEIQIDLLVTGAEGYEIKSYPNEGWAGGYPPHNIYHTFQIYEFIHTGRPVSISKVDAETGKEIEGAKLQVLNKEGKVVTTRDENGNTVSAEWTSTADGKPHVVYGLTPGETYTLHEAEAPDGYKSSEDITFKTIVDVNEEDGTETRTVESTGTVTKEGVILSEGKVLPKTDQTPVCTVSTVDTGKTKTLAVTGSYGTLTVKSSNVKVATATVSGTNITVKGAAVGTAILTITAAGDKTHNAATITRTVKVTPAATGKFKVTAAANGKGFKLTWSKVPGATGYVIYRNDRKIKTVGNVKTYTDAKANTNGAKYTYKVYAKAATGTSSQFKSVVTYKVTRPAIKALANSAAGKMTAKWSKNAKATGYQLQYCTKSTFKGKKTITMPKNTKVAKTISNLTKEKTYYVRLRTYKKVGGKAYFSAWSVTKKVKIKK